MREIIFGMVCILLGLTLIFNLIVAIILVRRLKALQLYKTSKLRGILEQKAQEELINNW